MHSGTNSVGAAGPMQFLAGTWATEAVNAPGDPPGQPPNIYDEADAVYSAAHYLHDSGAPGDWPGAIFAYNHSSGYMQQVLSQAQSYYTQGLTAQGSAASTTTSGSPAASAGNPFSVPAASGDPAGPITLAPGQPTIVATTYFTDQTGAWGDDLLVNHDSYAELSPGITGAQVTRQNATMLGGLSYMTPLRVTNPQNGRSVILYKRDIGAGQPLSNTLDGYHYRIDLTAWADQQIGLSGSGLVHVTRLTGPVSTPGGGQACSASSPFAPAGSGLDPIPGFTIGRDDMGVDATAPVGTPVYAPLDSQLVEVVGDWYAGQPLLLFRFLNPPAGAPSPYWYVAEQITPVSTAVGTIFRARQAVARFAPERHRDRDRLGLAHLNATHARRRDRSRRRQPAAGSNRDLGGELQALLRHPLMGEKTMSLHADRSALERRRALVAALVALAVGGCGGTSDAVSHAVSGATRVSGATTQLSRQLMRSWCPQAVAGGGRRLTEAQARDCLHRAWDGWLRELRQNGYDPTRVGR